ncbi:MAG TPA: small basic family protein [Candidatus Dormibacteraeota bacterium]
MPVILIVLVAAAVGLALGLLSPVTIPVAYARYTAVALLAALDSIFGAFKAYLAGTFEPRVFISGLVTNMALAGGLTWVGDKLGVDLSIAAIVAFGVRIFNNLGAIRRHYL